MAINFMINLGKKLFTADEWGRKFYAGFQYLNNNLTLIINIAVLDGKSTPDSFMILV